ncbi:DNA polymerase ligase N-terminal domain-containing protein [Methanotrichaceae archaeon M04Ac]|jgi:DNA ligase D-like protein (predicted 3'-phosphoesterase)|uniref:DNA polymerase ligase N-terminal domain-containing protein n=1 Tax=Candidatus Methanocrinis alkalitolerans TaxID=3033395 RepID=A0ABT5XHD1_9EURY|nr:DNA polymerase ligase N-terminal domain-containing protein [Candidatus Methanocrinis alkalitolerans]MCR3884299.1 DNA ligase [Methanothrix sp.]MDF0594119.1 DNA polymerase ligase N-terminal domain-containing protein [Candidatus Methanocrinis alkalitolerans]
MPEVDKLQAYRKKRDFSRTSEPPGSGGITPGDKPRFSVQKHRAKKLHYDLRLDVGGVLKSWAVPKGPSLDTKTKRLAVPTEDHPLDYIDFEGTIPTGEYGAGTVIVWDIGTYENTTSADGKEVSIAEALERGHATFLLSGEKLRGGYALTRTGRGKNERWILVKMKDDFAKADDDVLEREPNSALTGRSLKEVEEEDEGRAA